MGKRTMTGFAQSQSTSGNLEGLYLELSVDARYNFKCRSFQPKLYNYGGATYNQYLSLASLRALDEVGPRNQSKPLGW